MSNDPPSNPEAYVPLPDGRKILVTIVTPRAALIRALAALVTCLGETADDLSSPNRTAILTRCIDECSRALTQMGATDG